MQVSIIGLKWGDCGKGSESDRWAHALRETGTVVGVKTTGAAQCAHRVVDPYYGPFVFAQLSGGSFAGIDTYIGPEFACNLDWLERERSRFRLLTGMSPNVWISPHTQLITEEHIQMGRKREEEVKHGSTGAGVLYARRYPVTFAMLESGLKRFHPHLYRQAAPYVRSFPPPADHYVAEAGQGVLLDQFYGDFPHVTPSDTTHGPAQRLLGKIHRVGCMRTYETRHGAGPLPTEGMGGVPTDDPANSKETSPFAGDFRTGMLDLERTLYALSIAPCDQLTISCWDRHSPTEAWDGTKIVPIETIEGALGFKGTVVHKAGPMRTDIREVVSA